jgi:LemA protein
MKGNSGLKFLIIMAIMFPIIIGIGIVIIMPNLFYISIVLLIISIVIMSTVVGKHNEIIRYKNKVKESFALIDVQLKLRFDLIPNLVSVVKKYAEHEKEVLTEITKLRKQAVESTIEKEKIEYANKIVPQIKNIVAISENYPDLKANTLFKSLMEQLVDVEDRIASARRIYDSNVSVYNMAIEQFPNSFVAKTYGFEREEMFKIESGEAIATKIHLE